MKIKSSYPRFLLISTAIVLLSACSVADFKQPITDLNTAIDDSISTVEEIDREVTQVQNTRWRKQVTEGKAFLLTPADSCASGETSCSLIIRFQGVPGNKGTFPKRSLMSEAHVGLKGLKKYVANLQAIVDADTASKISTHANAALASASEIEVEIAKAKDQNAEAKEVIKAYNEPTLAVINWLVTQYVERMKYNALASATKRAQPILESLIEYHDINSLAASQLKSSAALKAFTKAQDAYDEANPKTDKIIDNYVLAVATYDTVLKGNSAQPLKSFLKAHTKLNASLNGNGKTSIADAIAAIDQFKTQAKEFKKIMKDFQKIAANEAGE